MEAAGVPAFGWDTYVLAEAEDINTANSLITTENTMEMSFKGTL